MDTEELLIGWKESGVTKTFPVRQKYTKTKVKIKKKIYLEQKRIDPSVKIWNKLEKPKFKSEIKIFENVKHALP